VPSPKPVSGLAHQVHDYLALAAAMGAKAELLAPRLYLNEADIRTAKSQLMPAAPSSLFWCALNPGAEYGPAKRWPADRFAAAAAQISRATGCGWIITGGKADAEPAMRINHALSRAKVPHTFNLAGRTSLHQLCAIFNLSRLVLTNDTGPMHVAAAVGTPVVVPFGSTSPDLTGPGLPEQSPSAHALLRSAAPCSPCYLRECPIDFRCMLGISVEEIVKAALALLATSDKGVTIKPS
jgi:heptosyltransferase-2